MSCKPLWILLATAASLAAVPSFNRDVRPILQKHCQGCHQPASMSSGLDLTSFAAFQKGGKRGPAFVAGKPDESLAIRYMTATAQPRMPLGGEPLKAEQIELVREWITAGAIDDSTPEISSNAADRLHAAAGDHGTSFFARRKHYRRIRQPGNSAAQSRWQRAFEASARQSRAAPVGRVQQRRKAAHCGRRHAGAVRRSTDLGCRIAVNCCTLQP